MSKYSDWTPTSANINSLPDRIKSYIHDLGTLCDPADIVAENTLLMDQTKMLDRYINYIKNQRIIKMKLQEYLDEYHAGNKASMARSFGRTPRGLQKAFKRPDWWRVVIEGNDHILVQVRGICRPQ